MADGVIRLEVPDWQIGKEVTVYFPDTMRLHSVCEKDNIVRCKDCKHRCNKKKCIVAFVADKQDFLIFFYDNHGEWFCADGERKE